MANAQISVITLERLSNGAGFENNVSNDYDETFLTKKCQ